MRLRRDLLSEAHADDARVVARDVERDLLDRLDLGHGVVRMVPDAHADKGVPRLHDLHDGRVAVRTDRERGERLQGLQNYFLGRGMSAPYT